MRSRWWNWILILLLFVAVGLIGLSFLADLGGERWLVQALASIILASVVALFFIRSSVRSSQVLFHRELRADEIIARAVQQSYARSGGVAIYPMGLSPRERLYFDFIAGLRGLRYFESVRYSIGVRPLSTEAEESLLYAAKGLYFKGKLYAWTNDELVSQAKQLAARFTDNERFRRLFENQLGRCEDEWEAALRDCASKDLLARSREFRRCKCLVMEAMIEAEGPCVLQLFGSSWDALQCEALLRNERKRGSE